MTAQLWLLATLLALLTGMVSGKAWERYKLRDGRWVDRRRLRDTPPQATLDHKERTTNLRNAFACDIPLAGKHVAVIDDVMTSGASLSELAKAVRKQGATRVSAGVVARPLPH